MRAALASLLETPIEQVPDFTTIEGETEHGGWKYENWWLSLQTWVMDRGFQFIEIQLDRKTWQPLPYEIFAIFIGTTASGIRHAIIGKLLDAGFFPFFDPLGPESKTVPFEQVEAVCLLVPRDPMIMIRMGRALEEIELMAAGLKSNRIVAEAIRDISRGALGKKVYGAPTILNANGELPPR